MQTTQNLVNVLKPNSTGIKFTWRYPNGDRPAQMSIAGFGFGAAPNVAIYADWTGGTVGDTVPLDSATVGDFTTAHYATSLLPKYFSAFNKVGISLREGGNDAVTNNRLTGFVKQLAAHENFFMAFEICVPPGRYFPGASAADTLPNVSAVKPVWISDQALDSATKADVVLASWIGASFNFLGNTCPFNIYMESSFDFNEWNNFSGYAIAGTPDPFVNNGEVMAMQTNNLGTFIDLITNTPTFGSGATDAQYTHVNVPAWSGNGSQDNAQLLFSYFYYACSDDANVKKRIELINSPVYANATKRRVIAADEWTQGVSADGEFDTIEFTPSNKMKEGMTHICVVQGNTPLKIIPINPVDNWQEGLPPVVTSASGTYANGNTITLNGSNFSTKNSSQLLFTNFSEGVVGQRSEHFHYWNMVGTADYLITDGVSAPLGSGKILRAHPIQQTFTEIHHELEEDTDELFMEMWLRLNRIDFTSSPDAPQIKMPRFVDGTGEESMQNRPLHLDLLLQADSTMQITTGPTVGAGAWYQKNGSPILDNDTWYKLVMYFKKGDLDTPNGERFLKIGDYVEFTNSGYVGKHFASPIIGNVNPAAYAGEPVINHTSETAAYLFRRIALTYFQRAQQETISDVAQLFINNSRESILISDSPTWAGIDHTKSHTVRTFTRVHNVITFRAEIGQFPTGALYAYVINRDGLFNPNGCLVRAA